MALKFMKAGAQKKAAEDDAADEAGSAPKSDGKFKPGGKKTETASGGSSKSSSNAPGFMKRGAAAREALANEEAKAELRKAEAGRMFRFWLNDGEERQITFLDGKLDEEGMLDIQMYYEHTLNVNGNWENFVCTAEVDQSQPCPICEKGDRAALVGVMTVIDHTPHTIKNGASKGNVIQHSRKLFVAKRQTIEQLTVLAKKRGGLQGCTFDVSRIGDKAARVGSQFDFQHKFTTRQEILEACGLEKEEDVTPADYEAEVRYYSPEELLELGVGKAPSGIGYGNKSGGSKSSMSDEL